MASSLDLQELLKTFCDNVYFQPPSNTEMNYPAIKYSRNSIENKHANNRVYKQDYSYTITVIDYDPDSEIVRKVSTIPGIRHNRAYQADNLNHDTFTLYY